ncbi:Hydrogenase domain-containing protein [Desulfonema magnum]|uniref:Hydrogenase domain-containing protein n=2 Tax=Desulfonema magnum TaxID=45655 RepID=A0A975BKP4_9BACT|nr:Hydrogenase domain-containing protein [Desulfonema magnum]
MRLQYPANIKIIRVPCTGKIDVLHILRAFEKGADGVYAVGCMEGDCRYESGNFRAKKRVEQAQQILNTIGISGERTRMYNLSSGEGPLFAEIAREMTEKIRKLGPNPIKLAKKKAA